MVLNHSPLPQRGSVSTGHVLVISAAIHGPETGQESSQLKGFSPVPGQDIIC